MKQAVAVSTRARTKSARLIGDPMRTVILEDHMGWLRYT